MYILSLTFNVYLVWKWFYIVMPMIEFTFHFNKPSTDGTSIEYEMQNRALKKIGLTLRFELNTKRNVF